MCQNPAIRVLIRALRCPGRPHRSHQVDIRRFGMPVDPMHPIGPVLNLWYLRSHLPTSKQIQTRLCTVSRPLSNSACQYCGVFDPVFHGLIAFPQSPQDLLKGVYDMGFSKPSKIQERALPLLLSNPYALVLSLCTRRPIQSIHCPDHRI